jgi:hypothetical protein
VNQVEALEVLADQYDGYNIEGPMGLRWFLDQAHRALLCSRTDQRLMLGTDGKPVTFNTTPATNRGPYTITGMWQIGMVLVEVGTIGSLLDNMRGTDYGMRSNTDIPLYFPRISGIDYTRIPHCSTRPATDTTDAHVTFSVDPGATTGVYRAYGWSMPARLLSDAIPFEIPSPWDEIYLLPAAGKLIQGRENGTFLEARADIIRVIKPLLDNEMNAGEQGQNYDAEDHGF